MVEPAISKSVIQEDDENNPLVSSNLTPAQRLTAPWKNEPVIYRPLPEPVRDHLSQSELPWYRVSVRIADQRIDPFYRILAGLTEEKQLVLGPGSDVIQIMLGLGKQVKGGIAEVNCVLPRNAPLEKLFRFYDDFVYPAFRGRTAGTTSVVLNWESTIDLRLIIDNADRGNYLLANTTGRLNNPLKLNAIALIPAEGEALLFFRTVDDYINFHSKIITLPDIERINAREWLDNIDKNCYLEDVTYVLQYAATTYARAKTCGWTFSQNSLEFLRTIASEISSDQKQQVQYFVRTNFEMSGITPPPLEHTFAQLGLEIQ